MYDLFAMQWTPEQEKAFEDYDNIYSYNEEYDDENYDSLLMARLIEEVFNRMKNDPDRERYRNDEENIKGILYKVTKDE